VTEFYWSRNNWTLPGGAPKANVDVWKEFLDAKKLGKPVEIVCRQRKFY